MHREISHTDAAFHEESNLALYLMTGLLGALMLVDLGPRVAAWAGWQGLAGVPTGIGEYRFALIAAILGGARIVYGALQGLLEGKIGADVALAIAATRPRGLSPSGGPWQGPALEWPRALFRRRGGGDAPHPHRASAAQEEPKGRRHAPACRADRRRGSSSRSPGRCRSQRCGRISPRTMRSKPTRRSGFSAVRRARRWPG